MGQLGTVCEPWPLSPSCPGWDPDPLKWTDEQRLAVLLASVRLWRLTAGRYGVCPFTVRPCGQDCSGSGYAATWAVGMPWVPLLIAGEWINCSSCGCTGGPCGGCCPRLCEVSLPGPVASITTVKVDGAIVDPSNYVVHDRDKLVGQGDYCWPTCNDYRYPDTEPGTWSVTYMRGITPPPDAIAAGNILACQIAEMCKSKKCDVPARATSVDREGVSYQLLDPDTYFDERRTGIPEVDAWLALVNPNGMLTPPTLWSPARRTPREQTWPVTP